MPIYDIFFVFLLLLIGLRAHVCRAVFLYPFMDFVSVFISSWSLPVCPFSLFCVLCLYLRIFVSVLSFIYSVILFYVLVLYYGITFFFAFLYFQFLFLFCNHFLSSLFIISPFITLLSSTYFLPSYGQTNCSFRHEAARLRSVLQQARRALSRPPFVPS